MKTLLLVVFAFASFSLLAQNATERPRQEFVVQLSENTLTLAPGESKTVTVSVVRSKSFQGGKVKLGTSTVLPQGVTLTFEPGEGDFETSKATLTATPEAAAGAYTLVINGLMHHKTKGSALKLEIAGNRNAGN